LILVTVTISQKAEVFLGNYRRQGLTLRWNTFTLRCIVSEAAQIKVRLWRMYSIVFVYG